MLHKRIYQIINGRLLCIIIIGESNSGGNGNLNSVSALERLDNDRIKYLNNDTLRFNILKVYGDVDVANAQLGHCPRTEFMNGKYHGWELEAGNWARESKLNGFDFYMMKGSQGGATVENWLDENEYNGGTCQVWTFATFKDRLAAFKAQLPDTKPIQYMIMASLGGNNAKAGTDSYVYKDKYTQVIENVRAEIDIQNIPVYSTLFNQPDIVGIEDYNDRQLEMEIADPHFHTIDMTGQPFNIPDYDHWSSVGVKFFANDVLTHLKENYL